MFCSNPKCGSLLIAGIHKCPKCSDKHFYKKRNNNNKNNNKKSKLSDYQIQQLEQGIEDLKLEMDGLGHVPIIKVKELETKLRKAPYELKEKGNELIGIIKDYGLYSCFSRQEAHYINKEHENIRRNNPSTVLCVMAKEIKCDYPESPCHNTIKMKTNDGKTTADYCMFS